MKLLGSLFIITSLIASVFCGGNSNYELTFYGQKGETHAKKDPSCPQYDDDNLPTYFAALSKKLHNYKDYCDKYAIFMSSNGSNVKTVAKAVIVDSCGECAAYHLDVSLNSFNKIAKQKDGTVPIIWGVYSKSGSEVAGPYYSSVSGTAKKLGLSSDAFVSAFRANAKSLASSGSSSKEFSASGAHIEQPKKTTVKATTKRIVTTKAAIPKNTPVAPKAVTTTKAPFPLANQAKTPTTVGGPLQSPGTKQLGVPAKQLTPDSKQLPAVNATSSVVPAKPTQPVQQVKPKPVEKVIEDKKEEEDDGGIGTIGILAIGGGCLGAAGAGLLFMKKRSPNTYESMKQKFPEAFSNVKRGLSRSATSVKRTFTKRNANVKPVESAAISF
jgi:hypothetical protein